MTRPSASDPTDGAGFAFALAAVFATASNAVPAAAT